MKTVIEKTFQVEASIEKVWEFLSDPTKIVTCVPGAALTEKIDEKHYKGEVTAKFGPVKAKYNGNITIEELDISSHKMLLKGKGLDAKGKGSAEMIMNGILAKKEHETEVNFTMEIALTGMLAQFGARLIKDVSDQLLNQFVTNFKSLLGGKEVDNTINTGSMMGSVVKNKLGGIFGGDKS
ncbi:SRPBCC family protein [Fulvivirgaceae bacterium BMA12]|uniref:SRPBCC family protein n=1 Tax=Agaribacillus aureus TaxID=3051825 RepID=A0ABT8LDN4_9BACT|nr:SRPBCC family protein [Fulvivirgaceae bacterium BMA12]